MTAAKMFSRTDYLNGVISHDDFYNQFVTNGLCDMVGRVIGKDRIKNSSGINFSDIKSSEWNSICGMVMTYSASARRKAGLSDMECNALCIAKAAARKVKAA